MQNVGEPLFGIEVVETTGGKKTVVHGHSPANLFRRKKKKEISNKKHLNIVPTK